MKKLDKFPEPTRRTARKPALPAPGIATSAEVEPFPVFPIPPEVEAPGANVAEGLTIEDLVAATHVPGPVFRGEGGNTVPVKVPAKSLLSERMARPTDGAPHIVVKALAGTGKTTTGCEGLKRVLGMKSDLTPSDEQAAIWAEMEKSKGARSMCFTAFGKDIATELQRRVPKLPNGRDAWKAGTTHSLGFYSVRKALGNNLEVQNNRSGQIISQLLAADIKDLRKSRPNLLRATIELVGLCKQTLCELDHTSLSKVASHYEVEVGGAAGTDDTTTKEEVYDLTAAVVDASKEVRGFVDFNDMVWLPLVCKLPVFRNDLMVADEFQDLNRARQELIKRGGTRLILVGDENQAIFGFAGADTEAMSRMTSDLRASPKGCIELPLSVTRRCGHAIVEEARSIVPGFSAHPSNPDGKVGRALYTGYKRDGRWVERPVDQTYLPMVGQDDLVLSRTNAHAVMQYFKLLRMGKDAYILGKDIGQKIVDTLTDMRADSVPSLVGKLEGWYNIEMRKEQEKDFPSEARIISIGDRYQCLLFFAEDAYTVREVIDRVERAFAVKAGAVKLSSIHKAKGLEARRVWLLMPDGAGVPHPMAKGGWQLKQEYNLLYVAITRAIEELWYVES